MHRNSPCLCGASVLVRGDRQQTHPYVNIMSAEEKKQSKGVRESLWGIVILAKDDWRRSLWGGGISAET